MGLVQPPGAGEDTKTRTEMFKAVAVHSHKSNGHTAYVVTMPTPQFVPEAHFAAIVFKDDEPKYFMQKSPSTRYFTLEKSLEESAVFCECLPNGNRRNYGAGPVPDPAAFTKAVFERIGKAQPDSGRVLLEGGCLALMMFAPSSTEDYHLVRVEFEDGTQLTDAKVYHRNELELPPAFMGQKIKTLAINSQQP